MLTRQTALQTNQVLRQAILRSSLSAQPLQQTRSYAAKVASFSRKSEKVKRETTPSRKAGSIHPFRHTAAYSRWNKDGIPAITEGSVGSKILDTTEIFAGKNVGAALDSTKATVYQYSSPAIKALTHLGSFKPVQRNELFKNKATLIRDSTSVQLFDILQKGSAESSKSNRYCITGAKGVGKSTALAQAHAFAVEQGHVVIHISRALNLINGSGPAVLAKTPKNAPASTTPVFNQPAHAKTLMTKIAKANASVLSSLTTSKPLSYDLPGSKQLKFAQGTPLYNLLRVDSRLNRNCEVLADFFAELSAQSEVPVLFTCDDFNVFSHHQYSANRDTENKPIYHGDLLIPKLFLDYFSGEKVFQKGAVIASLSSYKNGYTIPHGLNEAAPNAYAKPEDYDPVLAGKLRNNGGVKKLEVKPFTFGETKTMLEYYDNASILHEPVTEAFVQEKYLLSGNGNALGLIKSCVGAF